jgi:hypothetical protein
MTDPRQTCDPLRLSSKRRGDEAARNHAKKGSSLHYSIT